MPYEKSVSGHGHKKLIFTTQILKCHQYCRFHSTMNLKTYIYPYINSLAPERCGNNFKTMIFKLIKRNSSLGTHCEIALRSMPWNARPMSQYMESRGPDMLWMNSDVNRYLDIHK